MYFHVRKKQFLQFLDVLTFWYLAWAASCIVCEFKRIISNKTVVNFGLGSDICSVIRESQLYSQRHGGRKIWLTEFAALKEHDTSKIIEYIEELLPRYHS